jgi:hypothetical protein
VVSPVSDSPPSPGQGRLGLTYGCGGPYRPSSERRMDLTLKPNPNIPPSRRITAPDFIVMHGGLVVGWICKREAAINPASEWIWAITAVTGAPKSVRQPGSTATHDEARAALKGSWEECLEWARSSGRELEAGNALDAQSDIKDEDPLAALVSEAQLAGRG